MRRTRWFLPFIALVPALAVVGAQRPLSLTVRTPAGMQISAATATSTEPKGNATGTIGDQSVVFANLAANVVYDVRLELADGGVIQGVNLGWYDDEPPKPYPGELTDDDRAAIKAIVDVPSFYNNSEILAVQGDHSRATALVQLVRRQGLLQRQRRSRLAGGTLVLRGGVWGLGKGGAAEPRTSAREIQDP